MSMRFGVAAALLVLVQLDWRARWAEMRSKYDCCRATDRRDVPQEVNIDADHFFNCIDRW